jgi:hypothetical protein
MTEPLSPATQAVLDAYINAPCGKSRGVWVAAALRAAADQVEQRWRGFSHEACQEIRAIAAELEAAND